MRGATRQVEEDGESGNPALELLAEMTCHTLSIVAPTPTMVAPSAGNSTTSSH